MGKTQNLGLDLINSGSAPNTWGQRLNENFERIDAKSLLVDNALADIFTGQFDYIIWSEDSGGIPGANCNYTGFSDEDGSFGLFDSLHPDGTGFKEFRTYFIRGGSYKLYQDLDIPRGCVIIGESEDLVHVDLDGNSIEFTKQEFNHSIAGLTVTPHSSENETQFNGTDVAKDLLLGTEEEVSPSAWRWFISPDSGRLVKGVTDDDVWIDKYYASPSGTLVLSLEPVLLWGISLYNGTVGPPSGTEHMKYARMKLRLRSIDLKIFEFENSELELDIDNLGSSATLNVSLLGSEADVHFRKCDNGVTVTNFYTDGGKLNVMVHGDCGSTFIDNVVAAMGLSTTSEVKFSTEDSSGIINGMSFAHMAPAADNTTFGMLSGWGLGDSGGARNVMIGYNVAPSATNTIDDNVLIGHEVMKDRTAVSTYENVAIGSGVAESITSGSLYGNVYVGYNILNATDEDSYDNVMVGTGIAQVATAGDINRNVCVGANIFSSATTNSGFSENVVLGANILSQATTPAIVAYNVVLGFNAMYNSTVGEFNTIIGYEAMYNTTDSGAYNIAIGRRALYQVNDASHNIAVGDRAIGGGADTTGEYNIAIGYESGTALTSGGYNVLIGKEAGTALTSGEYNINIGHNAGLSATVATYNVLFGYDSGSNITSGSTNIGIGREAIKGDSGGMSGEENVAIGSYALNSISSGGYNVSIGHDAGINTTTGRKNVIIGFNSGSTITTHESAVIIGDSASGGSNPYYTVAIGPASSSYYRGVAIGYSASVNDNDGVAIGYYTSADIDSVAVGESANAFSNGVSVGRSAGYNITGGSNVICIGFNAGPASSGSYSDRIYMGDTSITWAGCQVSWSTYSDRRLKEDIGESDLGIDFIMRLMPSRFKLKNRTENDERYHYGFIAQDVKQIVGDIGIMFAGYDDPKEIGGEGNLSLTYSEFIAPMVKAIQEQQAVIEDLKKRIEALEGGAS